MSTVVETSRLLQYGLFDCAQDNILGQHLYYCFHLFS